MWNPGGLEDDDSDIEVWDSGEDNVLGGFDGNAEEEKVAASKPPAFAAGKVRVRGEQPNPGKNLRGLPKKRATASKSPPSARGKVRILEDRHTSAGNSEEERATPSKPPCSVAGKVGGSGEQPSLEENLGVLPKKKQATASRLPSSASARQKFRVLEDRHVSAGKASVPSDPVTTPESPSSVAGETVRGDVGKTVAPTENVRILGNESSDAATGGGSKRVLPPWVSGSEQWGGGKWKDDTRKKKMEEKRDMIPLKKVIEAILRNSGETEEGNMIKNFSYVEFLKSMGIKFPG